MCKLVRKMLQFIQEDVFNFVLIEYLDLESRINLSKVLDRSYQCVRLLNPDLPFAQRILKCRLKRITSTLKKALLDIEYTVGYKRHCKFFRLLKQVGGSENILISRYCPNFRETLVKKCKEFADVDTYKAVLRIPKKWVQLLQRTSRKTLANLERNPIIYDIGPMFASFSI